jgi:hypothetical protein
MELSDNLYCTEFLLDLIYYEMLYRTLSPEMEYLFKRHLEKCPNCRRWVVGFHRTLHKPEVVRNVG